MVKRTQRDALVPDWFDRSKYDGLASFDKDEWYWQISARYYLYLHVNDKANGFPTPKLGDELLNDIRLTPLLDFSNERNSEYKRKLLIKPHAVELASWREARQLFSSVPAEYSDIALQYLLGNVRACDMPAELLHHKTDYARYGTVTVDFSLPEQVLMKSFRALIQGMQRQPTVAAEIRERHRNPSLTEWRRIGILPYMDLLIWEIENQISIPDRIYADVIFEGSEESEETVRKTTRPQVKKILEGNLLMILGAMENR